MIFDPICLDCCPRNNRKIKSVVFDVDPCIMKVMSKMLHPKKKNREEGEDKLKENSSTS